MFNFPQSPKLALAYPNDRIVCFVQIMNCRLFCLSRVEKNMTLGKCKERYSRWVFLPYLWPILERQGQIGEAEEE